MPRPLGLSAWRSPRAFTAVIVYAYVPAGTSFPALSRPFQLMCTVPAGCVPRSIVRTCMTCPGGAMRTQTWAGSDSVKETRCAVNSGLTVKRENWVAPRSGAGVGVAGAVAVAVTVTGRVGGGVGVAIAVAVGSHVDVALGWPVAAGRSVDVALGWLVAVSCHVGVTVGRLVAVAAAVDVGTAVGVATGGLVAVAVGVAVGLDGAASIMRG